MPTEPAQAEGLLAKEDVLTVSRTLELALFMDAQARSVESRGEVTNLPVKTCNLPCC
jgi:hypothetical protein